MLEQLKHKFNTDKGNGHNYLKVYDILFKKFKEKNINFLEIGVLFGESLKLFSSYFKNGKIYGIENFEQKDGHSFHNFKPVIADEVIKNIENYDNIALLNFDCENLSKIKENITGIKFNIIIDDASHIIEQQINNLKNYSEYLTDDGIYICEDITSNYNGEILLQEAQKIFTNKKISVLELDINNRADDRLLIVQ